MEESFLENIVQWNLSKAATLKRPKVVFKTIYRLMQVKSIAECSQ